MYITNNITKEQLKEILGYIENKKIFFIIPKDIKEDYRRKRLYILLDGGRIIGSFSLVYEKDNAYYAIKRLSVFNFIDQKKGYGSLMVKMAMRLGYRPIGMTPWITNPISTGIAKKAGMELQYIFNNRYGWWLKW